MILVAEAYSVERLLYSSKERWEYSLITCTHGLLVKNPALLSVFGQVAQEKCRLNGLDTLKEG